MSFQKTKKHLGRLLAHENNSVIALSGTWGTGKTHLWTEVKFESDDKKVKNSLYVSLFGLSNLDQVKRKLMESAIPVVEENGDLFDGIKHIYRAGVKAASEHYKGLAALNDLNVLLMAPVVLRDKVIVIDDIERKHEKLGIDEILGFIDEFTVKHGARFLLILNTDKMADKTVWEKFREKVIDHEIALEITSDEAFDIANANHSLPYAATLKQANQIIGISNIRVLSKAIAFIKDLFKNHTALEKKVQERFVPAAFLICALHYKVVPDGPTIDYVLSFNSLVETAASGKIGDNERLQKWTDLMNRLGLSKSDQFEYEVATALRTGLIEHASFDEAITAYQRPWRVQLATKRVKEFVEDYNWAGKKSDTDLLREANSMLDMVKDMDADAVSVLCSITSKMDQPILTKTLIEQWLGTHHFTPEEASNLLSTGPREHVHPAIIKHLRLLAEQTTSRSYDLETVAQRIQMNFHDDEDEKVIANSSVEQYIQTLKSLDKEEFVDFVRLHLNWIRFGKHYPYKVAGRQKFVEACARIIEAEPESRLARILRRNVFNDATSDLRNNVEGADH